MKINKVFCMLVMLFSMNIAVAYQVPVYTEDKMALMVSMEQSQFAIKLKSNPTTGYSWFLRDYDENLIRPLKHTFVAPANKKLLGAPGFELWTFQMKPAAFNVPRQTTIRFIYARPWDMTDQGKQLVFSVTTSSAEKK